MDAGMDPGTFAWLLSEPGQRLLALAAEGDGSLGYAESLRRDHPADRVAAALSVADLRRRGREKFGALADRMYFTRDALEQATRLPVARHRAARLAAAAPASVVDLGCGVGGDLVALAGAGLTVAGVDRDPLRVAMARANLAALDLPGAVAVADVTAVDLSPFDVAFADPARRTGAGRRFDVEDWVPPWSFVTSLLDRRSGLGGCAKVAPGLPHALVPEGVEAEWVSDRGRLKEAVLWSPRLATASRRATVLGERGLASLTDADDPGAEVRPLGAFLHEPDDAVIRAGLVTAVAAAVGGGLVDPRIAWVTTDTPARTPFARAYEVLERLPYQEKQLRAALRERGVGRLTVKTRGVQQSPEGLRARMRLAGPEEATLVLTRIADRGAALLVRLV